MLWDAFISHASEDKVSAARPLAEALTRSGLRVWLDENELKIGDSLREKIDHGLANSRFGIVILSPAFFAKDWPARELDGLSARETRSQKVVLPVWHEIDHAFVARHSPMLADKIGASTARGIDQVALAILKVITPEGGNPSILRADGDARALFDRPESLIGHSIGSYQLVKFIGQGGSGAVFRATERTTKQDVAVKLFYPLADSLMSFYGLFQRAFLGISAVDHPNVGKALSFGHTQVGSSKTCYLAMEYIEGKTLDVWSRSIDRDPDRLEKRLWAAIRISDALRAAHEAKYLDAFGLEVRGVIHGDVKPANVLVGDRVQLIDFLLLDIQRLLDPRVIPQNYDLKLPARPMTEAFGTPGFMSPEQEQSGLITVKSDIFGLGVTLCHLFGKGGKDWYEVLADNTLPYRLRKLLVTMIDAVDKRPEDMTQVVAELRAIIRGVELQK
jgi:Protein kinase domain/TIR domain